MTAIMTVQSESSSTFPGAQTLHYTEQFLS